MKIINLVFASLLVFVISASITNAQTQFIKYKKYLIPISTTAVCEKPKVIVSTDIRPLATPLVAGEDDDIQAMVHYLASSYRFDTRGLISSPGGGAGTTDTIGWLINNYNQDRSSLIGNTGRDYPTKLELDAVVVQGNKDTSGMLNAYSSTNPDHKGAKLIRDEVEKIVSGGECGPIYFLAWGGVSDLAIALSGNDSTESLSNAQVAQNIRVFSIGAGNTPTANEDAIQGIYWDYIVSDYLANDGLWLIHSDDTFRGVYINTASTDLQKLKNKLGTFGCLGDVLGQTNTGPNTAIKMGDSSSVMYLMNGDFNHPTTDSWGGRYRLTSNNTQFWTDIFGANEADRATIAPLGVVAADGVATPIDSIYGAWYEDMRRANSNSSSCIAQP